MEIRPRPPSLAILVAGFITATGVLRAQSLAEAPTFSADQLRGLVRQSSASCWVGDEKVGFASFSWSVREIGGIERFVATESSTTWGFRSSGPIECEGERRLEFRLAPPQDLIVAERRVRSRVDPDSVECDHWVIENHDSRSVRRSRRFLVTSAGDSRPLGDPSETVDVRCPLDLSSSYMPAFRLGLVQRQGRLERCRYYELDFETGTAKPTVKDWTPALSRRADGPIGVAGWMRFGMGNVLGLDHQGWIREQHLHWNPLSAADAILEPTGRGELPTGRWPLHWFPLDLPEAAVKANSRLDSSGWLASRIRFESKLPEPGEVAALTLGFPRDWASLFVSDEAQTLVLTNDVARAQLRVRRREPRLPYPTRGKPWNQYGLRDFNSPMIHWFLIAREARRAPTEMARLSLLLENLQFASSQTFGQPERANWRSLVQGGCLSSAEFADTLVKAATAVGISARLIRGLALSAEESAFVPRHWCEVHVNGQWLSVDPYARRIGLDATYIRLARVVGEEKARLDALAFPRFSVE